MTVREFDILNDPFCSPIYIATSKAILEILQKYHCIEIDSNKSYNQMFNEIMKEYEPLFPKAVVKSDYYFIALAYFHLLCEHYNINYVDALNDMNISLIRWTDFGIALYINEEE